MLLSKRYLIKESIVFAQTNDCIIFDFRYE
jgi:hypothetical protein